jgi:hypothetical protein
MKLVLAVRALAPHGLRYGSFVAGLEEALVVVKTGALQQMRLFW